MYSPFPSSLFHYLTEPQTFMSFDIYIKLILSYLKKKNQNERVPVVLLAVEN